MKISRKMTAKMILKRETLRTLDEATLQAAQGGQQAPSGNQSYYPPTTSVMAQPMPGHDPDTAPGLFYPCGLP